MCHQSLIIHFFRFPLSFSVFSYKHQMSEGSNNYYTNILGAGYLLRSDTDKQFAMYYEHNYCMGRSNHAFVVFPCISFWFLVSSNVLWKMLLLHRKKKMIGVIIEMVTRVRVKKNHRHYDDRDSAENLRPPYFSASIVQLWKRHGFFLDEYLPMIQQIVRLKQALSIFGSE